MIFTLIFFLIISLGYPIYSGIRQFFRILVSMSPIYKLLYVVDDISAWLKAKIQVTEYVFLGILFVSITYCQEVVNAPVYNLKDKNLIEILSLIVSILALYGIYIGFLQYLTDRNEGNLFLGKSKVNYLTDNSIWYQMTQSNAFLALLILSIAMPISFKLNIFVSWVKFSPYYLPLQYIWQTIIILLLIIYLFLLRMSLKIIYITLLMKTGSDSGLQGIMQMEIQKTYERAFWRNYKDYYNNNFEWTIDMLERDLKKLKPQEIDEYLSIVFKGIDHEFIFQSKKKLWRDINLDNLSNFYIHYIQKKWKFLNENIDKISYVVWKELIDKDIQHINNFEEKLNKRLVISKGISYFEINVTEYLYDQLLNKANTNMQEIIDSATESTKYLQINSKSSKIREINELELEKYKWEKIFSKFNELESSKKLPKLRKIANNDLNEKGMIDIYNSDLYSEVCFTFLANNYGRITFDINSKNHLKSLIFSMNDEYLITYCLYQLLYTDGSDFKVNFSFYDNILKKVLNFYNDNEYKYYFEFAKDVILSTNISHRITKNFLKELWLTREATISNLSDWYNRFGDNHRSTPFTLLYIQNLFTTKFRNEYELRINLGNQKSIEEEHISIAALVCREYLQILACNPEYKEEKINSLIRSLFFTEKFDFNKALNGQTVEAILYCEYLIRYDFRHLRNWKYQDIFLNGTQLTYKNHKRTYYFNNHDIMHFFVLKTIDSSYNEYYKIPEFRKELKRSINDYLIRNDIDIPDYIENLYNILNNHELIKLSIIEKKHIINKLQNII